MQSHCCRVCTCHGPLIFSANITSNFNESVSRQSIVVICLRIIECETNQDENLIQFHKLMQFKRNSVPRYKEMSKYVDHLVFSLDVKQSRYGLNQG